ncbi:MAG: Crp/Fnr family transcriptional regulator [Candidatus Dormibacterales bacterium]
MNDPLDQIINTPLFKGATRGELEHLRPSIRPRRFDRGAYLFREGDPSSHLYVIVHGEVKIAHASQSGSEVVFSIAGPGDVLGEMSIFEQEGTRTADAQALGQAECLIIARAPLIEFISTRPALLLHIISTLSGYIKRKDAALGEASFLDIPARVALKLIELAATKGVASADGIVIDMLLSQRTLAGMIGASRENVNRALSRFADLGYIRLTRGKVQVLDRDQLRRRGSLPL